MLDIKSEIVKKAIQFFKYRKEVVAVYLFGSYARDKARKESDIDLAVLFKNEETPRQFMLKKEFTIELSRILRKDLHILIMNNAGEQALFQIFKSGQCILNHRPELLSHFKMLSFSMISEFAYYRDIMRKGFIRRIMGEGS